MHAVLVYYAYNINTTPPFNTALVVLFARSLFQLLQSKIYTSLDMQTLWFLNEIYLYILFVHPTTMITKMYSKYDPKKTH